MNIELSEQEQIRRESLAKLREAGIDPYPAAEYPVNATALRCFPGFLALAACVHGASRTSVHPRDRLPAFRTISTEKASSTSRDGGNRLST